jgi:hypothetical protein
MSELYHPEVRPDAPATLLTVPHGGVPNGGPGAAATTETRFDTAQAAFAAAIEAQGNSDFALVQVSVEGGDVFDIDKIEEIYAYWSTPHRQA